MSNEEFPEIQATSPLVAAIGDTLRLIKDAIECVEKSDTPISTMVLWSRQLYDVLNLAFSVHRSIIAQGVLRKMPESIRPMFMSSVMSMRKDLLPFTYLDSECMYKLSLAIMSANGLAYRLLGVMGTNRFSIGIVRITSMLARAKSHNGMYLEKETILALLHELLDNVVSASMLLSLLGGVQ